MEKHGRLECPSCGSGRVSEKNMEGDMAKLTGKDSAFTCRDCGHQWSA